MPKNESLKKILVLGSGAIKIVMLVGTILNTWRDNLTILYTQIPGQAHMRTRIGSTKKWFYSVRDCIILLKEC